MFRSIKQWSIAALSTVFVMGAFGVSAQDGESLFKANCATCHQPHKDGTGPKLFGVRQKWADGGAKEGSIYQWVGNWKAAAASDPYAASVAKVKPTDMNTFPSLVGKQKEIDAIFDYIDAQPLATAVAGPPTEGGDPAAEEEEGFSWIWVIMGLTFVVIIMAVGGVRRQLNNATKEAAGQFPSDDRSYGDEFKTWAWKNRKYVGLAGLVITISVVVMLFLSLYSIGVIENYQPSQPIEFPHDIHTGVNGIDCKYCHNSVTKSKTAGLPTVNVCMNCHKQISGDGEQVAKIAQIYKAAGWDGSQYTGKTSEIVWNKVHVLPDHVYFNHSQHVVAGGVDCKQCHGDMTKQNETARVVPVGELNKIEGNVQLTRATLTMGWCIECHQEKAIAEGPLDTKNNAYYAEIHKRLLNNDRKLYDKYLEDGKVTVKELGGWECAKCHY